MLARGNCVRWNLTKIHQPKVGANLTKNLLLWLVIAIVLSAPLWAIIGVTAWTLLT